jgi:hypothetical protein
MLQQPQPDWKYPLFVYFFRNLREREDELVDPSLAVIDWQEDADGHHGTRLLSLLARQFGG